MLVEMLNGSLMLSELHMPWQVYKVISGYEALGETVVLQLPMSNIEKWSK